MGDDKRCEWCAGTDHAREVASLREENGRLGSLLVEADHDAGLLREEIATLEAQLAEAREGVRLICNDRADWSDGTVKVCGATGKNHPVHFTVDSDGRATGSDWSNSYAGRHALK